MSGMSRNGAVRDLPFIPNCKITCETCHQANDNTDEETSEDEFELLEPKCKDYTSELESDTKNWERVKTRRGDVYYLPKIRDKSIRLRNINDVSKYCSDNNIEFNPEDFDFEDKSVNYTASSETTSTDSDPEVNLVEVKIPNSFEESLTSPERHEWVKAMKLELSTLKSRLF
ncbi:hypothetical protein JTE90_018831 [Oedothorax gibbosus]|uniref:MBD domain-containing protein n=1 Tax=Oedothorax gibbosus TaxID=931172 RepID=A0AAV6UV92_9ARAC|nr:hypothetical protein JTE90_018831 [Oedothorax gibbosus]